MALAGATGVNESLLERLLHKVVPSSHQIGQAAHLERSCNRRVVIQGFKGAGCLLDACDELVQRKVRLALHANREQLDTSPVLGARVSGFARQLDGLLEDSAAAYEVTGDDEYVAEIGKQRHASRIGALEQARSTVEQVVPPPACRFRPMPAGQPQTDGRPP